jgi:hypothetical protein
MVVLLQRRRGKKQCVYANQIQLAENHSELAIIVIIQAHALQQDIGLAVNGNYIKGI